MTYWEVICDTVRMRPKHEKISCGDWRVSKQDFRVLKITHLQSDVMELTDQGNGLGWLISRGRSGCYNITLKFKKY